MGGKTKMGLKETKLEAVNWIHFTKDKDQVVGKYEHSNEPYGSITTGDFLISLPTISFPKT